ncbi:hypothetical protein [Natronoglycomyces albus]|uniref:Uncharacterized protein n=1 Tax=Natronoglycomyces albus TaxID=2811108 RepID=A0A895XTL9_9ACTN|nr:hypothetical protein [Natronoglycomyces albus]QSB05876.1 hypothetical protein JQS30_02820 [Natronoglycomyces albus]
MSVHDDFEEHKYFTPQTGVGGWKKEALDSTELLLSTNSCSLDGCTLARNPADQAWIELMSAIPKEDSLVRDLHTAPSSAVMPSEHMFNDIVSLLRPDNGERHSMESISKLWHDQIARPLYEDADSLEAVLKDASHAWHGADFDSLHEHIQQCLNALRTTADHAEVVSTELHEQSETIHTLQGGDSGEIPFPAPQFFDANIRKESADVHVRPPFWSEGNCQRVTMDEALAMVGADPEATEEFHQRELARAEEIIDQRLAQMTDEEIEATHLGTLEQEAIAQAREEIAPEVDNYKQSVHNGQLGESERINAVVLDHRDQTDATLSTSKYTMEPVEVEHTDHTERANGSGYGGLNMPGPTGTPDASGMTQPGGYTPGVSPTLHEVETGGSGGSGPNWRLPASASSSDDAVSDGLYAGNPGSLGAPGASPGGAAPGAAPGAAGGGGMFAPGARGGPGGTTGGAQRGPGGIGSVAGRGGATGGAASIGRGGTGGGGGVRGGAGGMGMMGGAAPGQGNQQQGAKKSEQRTLSAMGRPAPGTAKPSKEQTKEQAKGKDDKPAEKKSPLAAALEKRQAHKAEREPAPVTPPDPDQGHELDIHDQFDIEDDIWGAHSARKDEYR